MKRIIAAVACAILALGLAAPPAEAGLVNLSVNDDYYIGRIVDGIPSNLSDYRTYIENLIGLAPSTTDTIGTETYTRSSNTFASLPPPTLVGSEKHEDSEPPAGYNNFFNEQGWTYVIGKYDADKAGAYVWYVGNLRNFGLPSTLPYADKYDLSNFAVFNPTGSPPEEFPDGGVTLMLLGGALACLGVLRRSLT